MIVGISTKFDAAHWLPNYVGKCNRIHGHTWTVEVEVSGDVQTDGMVIDLTTLKRDVNILIEAFDHNMLNDYIYQPTCENIAQWLFDKLSNGYKVAGIKVREGDGGWSRI